MSLWKGSFWLALFENQGTQININILAILITETAKSMLSIKCTRKKDVRILKTDVGDIYENTHAPQVLCNARSTETHERMKLMYFIYL